MKFVHALLPVAAFGLATLMSLPASAQFSPGWRDNDGVRDGRWTWAQDRDRDRDDRYDRDRDDRGRYSNSNAYRNGYEEGMRDRSHSGKFHPRSNRWKNDNDRRAYNAGYNAGFNGRNGNGPWNGDRDRERGGNWGYGIPVYGGGGTRGGYGQTNASRFGYEDGFSYGQNDARRGKGYNATGSEAYEKADRGYTSGYGDKNAYRSAYRQSYQQGYQRGYYGR